MPVWSIDEIVAQTGAALLRGNPQQQVRAVSTDSRQMPDAALFVALQGERFDGHDFAAMALQNGAVAVLGSERDLLASLCRGAVREDAAVMHVPDTLLALQDLARAQRCRFQGTVVAITGSNGKTTVKEMTSAVLQQQLVTFRSPGNLNNHIGLPLTLLQMPLSAEVAVCEMGMNHLGEIRQLCSIAQPHLGVVTNVALAHVGYLGSIEQVQQAKGELIEALDADGIAIVNADDPLTYELGQRAAGRVITFGQGEAAMIRGRVQADHGFAGVQCELTINGATWEVRLAIPGVHNVMNALAATAVGVALHIAAPNIVAGLQNYKGMYGRMAIRSGQAGVTLVDDTYNANPESMRAALLFLAGVPGASRRVAVLGDMLELGDAAPALHYEIGAFARQCGVDRLITLGPLSRSLAEGAREAGMAAHQIHCAADRQDALTMLQQLLRAGDVVVLKGSRGMAMEHLVDALAADREST
jgi:UDP-N-acetylmuramoyl-tripeptide--D-alanyl-D-alanine ligase